MGAGHICRDLTCCNSNGTMNLAFKVVNIGTQAALVKFFAPHTVPQNLKKKMIIMI